jgi:hypothetical protein
MREFDIFSILRKGLKIMKKAIKREIFFVSVRIVVAECDQIRRWNRGKRWPKERRIGF